MKNNKDASKILKEMQDIQKRSEDILDFFYKRNIK
jgi:hypothetical protein